MKLSERITEIQPKALESILKVARSAIETVLPISDQEWAAFLRSSEMQARAEILEAASNITAIALALDEYQASTEVRLSALEARTSTITNYTTLVGGGGVGTASIQVSGEGSANLEQIALDFGPSAEPFLEG